MSLSTIPIRSQDIRIDDISSLSNISMHVLRLDKIHPVISGNKWFKLKYYLQQALEDNHHTILSFGGTYSNHIVATAFAARSIGLDSIGVIRGEEPAEWSPTLKEAKDLGMQFYFVNRADYDRKNDDLFIKELREKFGKFYMIPEGGYGVPGVKGASEILSFSASHSYSHILCSAGTGTMAAGMINASLPQQQMTIVSSMKGNMSLQDEISSLLSERKDFRLVHDYHFGGYAKYDKTLTEFMNSFYHQTKIPSDFVYSGKLFYAAMDLAKKGYFSPGEKVLLIHCGGLQGNRSLPAGTLDF